MTCEQSESHELERMTTMLAHSDCDVRFANHARHIARVNDDAWISDASEDGTRTSFRNRLGSVLVAIGTRLTAVPVNTPANSSIPGREWA